MQQYWLAKEHLVTCLFGLCCCHSIAVLLNIMFLFHCRTSQPRNCLHYLEVMLITAFKLCLFIQGKHVGACRHMQEEIHPPGMPWSHTQEDCLSLDSTWVKYANSTRDTNMFRNLDPIEIQPLHTWTLSQPMLDTSKDVALSLLCPMHISHRIIKSQYH